MDNAKKQEFTRRISVSNRGGMIVVIYDIYFAYQQEAQEHFEKQEWGEFHDALRKAQQAVKSLRDALDFTYPIARELYPLYQYALRELSACFYRRDTAGLDAANKVLRGLYAGFVEAAKQDASEPLMQHAQQVVAGMTYQKGSLTETLQDAMSHNRGFFA